MSNQSDPPCPPCAPATIDTDADAFPDGCPPVPNTFCDRNRKDNVWVERGPNPGDENRIGICLLDTMTEAQIIHSVERDDRARADLLLVTSNARLIEIAQTTPRLPLDEESDSLQTDLNRNSTAASMPFYAIFRGQPPFSQ